MYQDVYLRYTMSMEKKQSVAICINQYNQNMSMTTQQKVNKRIARVSRLKGINLNADGSYDLKEALLVGI